jgi:hypothetical protein
MRIIYNILISRPKIYIISNKHPETMLNSSHSMGLKKEKGKEKERALGTSLGPKILFKH